MKIVGLLSLFFALAFGSGDATGEALNLTTTWVGIASLIIFVVGYFFIATEENFHIDKAKPAIFIGTFMFLLIGFYMLVKGLYLQKTLLANGRFGVFHQPRRR